MLGCEDVRIRGCEDVKMFDRPPLLEEPFAQTLSGKACKKYFPFLLCSTKLGQSISQYYFVLQSLHKLLPGTTYSLLQKLAKSISQYYFVLQSLHPDFPVLLCTAKLAQSTFQYYFVLQSLHKARFSTTLYYKACTKHVPSTNPFPLLLNPPPP